jgi:hypothetical protein
MLVRPICKYCRRAMGHSADRPPNNALQRTHSPVTPLAGRPQASRQAARR